MPRKTGKTESMVPKTPVDENDLDAQLDEALMGTFPASDPVSLSNPTKPGRPHDTTERKPEAAAPVAPSRAEK